ncbi:MAG TPA: alpha/beta hydrolase [Jatrophihabitans sp.]|uniref:alpha/beta fold hydrolase n=1 Tax=Jatrophihabitans sp. TaxID=1932789 RepID=UPI002EF4981C
MTGYRLHDVAVRGGTLRVGSWRSQSLADGVPERVVLAVHGITASHLAWPLVARRLTEAPGTLVLAPDLRGRGRSSGLPGPWGMAQHAEDLAAVLDELAPGSQAVVTGHSMGAFVAVTLAARRPELVASLVLVDGGVPLVLPEGWTLQAAVAGLGPAADRLSMTFADRAAYRDFWREHPAFGEGFSATVRDYVDYDLDPDGPPWRSGCRVEAMTADHAELFADGPVDLAWPRLRTAVTFLRAPRGLFDEPGGLYPRQGLEHWRSRYPQLAVREVDGVNHYTVTLGELGAAAVSDSVAEQFDSTRPGIPQAG